MKVPKKQSSKIWEVYDTWMQAYLNNDPETYDSYFDEDYHFIGSTDNEEFLNREDTTEFFKTTGVQFAGLMDLRNESKILEQFGDYIFLTHFCDTWFKNEDEWSYYGRFRLTSIMHHTTAGWKFIYQHFSLPDSKSEEGQSIGFDKINAENQELREAIKRRTQELKLKNRALEIEGALERIRAEAVAMKSSSDLLDIVVSMRKEFINLGAKAHYFWYMAYKQEVYEKAMTSGDGSKIGMVMELPRDFHSSYDGMDEWEQNNEPTMILPLKTDDAIDYVNQMGLKGNFKKIDPKAPTAKDIRQIKGITFIMAKTSKGEIGYSLPGVVLEPPVEDLRLLQRFAEVFDQAYTRFLDLQKAEKQTREAQIEATLERVRSRSMAMQESNELGDVITQFYSELKGLDVNLDRCMLLIVDPPTEDITWWIAGKEGLLSKNGFLVKNNNYKSHKAYIDGWKNKRKKWRYILKGQEKKRWDKFAFSKTEWSNLPNAIKEDMSSIPGIHLSISSDGFGSLIVGSVESLSESQEELISRFTIAFNQTYTRFLDLQKAESQVREAQIEAALERVRAASMAMHKTEELGNVVTVLFYEFSRLQLDFYQVWINIFQIEQDISNCWFSPVEGLIDKPYTALIPLKPFENSSIKSWKAGEEFSFLSWSGRDEVDKIMEELSQLSEHSRFREIQNYKEMDRIEIADCNHKYGVLAMAKNEDFTSQDLDILKRFTRVFEQTYTRFLDLQTAEIQARDAQINLAVERVRASALAMHKSEEILNVVARLKDEVMGLNIFGVIAATIFLEAEDRYIRMWDLSSLEQSNQGYLAITDITFRLKEKDPNLYIKRIWENPKDYFIDIQNTQDLERITEFMYENNQFEIAKEVEDYIRSTNLKLLYHASQRLKKGKLCIDLLEPPSEEMETILNKMGAAFDLAYKRFEDIKKAEEQGRASQIEAALERVRAASMAMHKTEDLSDVVLVYFEQLKLLNIEFIQSWITIFHLDQGYVNVWFSPLSGLYDKPKHFKMPSTLFEETTLKSWKAGNPFSSISFKSKKEVDQFFQVCDEVTESTYFGDTQKMLKLERLEMLDANHKFGCISKSNVVEASEEEKELLQRFAKVFEQTYTRFQDLQKAEEQAREAQIETALEKVRSRSMAMQHSKEFQDVIKVIYNQFEASGIKIDHTGFIIDYKENDDMHIVLADNNAVFPKIVLPYFDCAHWNSFNKAKQNNEALFTNLLDFEEKNRFYNDLFKHIPDVPDTSLNHYLEVPGLAISTVLLDNIGLYIENFNGIPYTKEENNILHRFGKVFQQSYTRFLDLQKAEEQAREAKIEASLERVRSQSMGMQGTNDFSDVTTEMFNQLRNLGEDLYATGIVFCDKHEGHVEQWHSIPNGGMLTPFIVPIELDYIHKYRYDQWKKGEELFSIEIPSDFIEQHFEDIFNLPSAQVALKDLESRNAPMPAAPPWEIDYGASFKNGYILASSLRHFENMDILPRFAKVFEQAYTRFLDLQKAEAQAREAKIETALEKVRSRTMAMQQSSELPEAANILFLEVQKLGIPAWSAGYCIWQNGKHNASCNMSSEGEIQKGFILPSIGEGYDFYSPQEQGARFYVKELGGEALVKHYDFMMELPNVGEILKELQAAGLELPTFQVFHICYFKHGYVMFITYEEVPESHDIFKRFGLVFEQTYTRFLDLKLKEEQSDKLAKEKKRLEKTLSELQTTQKQLIQSEKMASLGELTAGIAHEIQNPLNFVNNFSDVSKELLEEMLEEIENGDLEEAKAIMNDVLQNLDKINHHGKRADGIVKGMLQHSRASGDKKELTDINALSEEYLRLAYHGLRAKDKSFNAELISDFDDSLNAINIVPQDIGRVILNLLTNAFYVVNEKQKTGLTAYKPTVKISTKRLKNSVKICVEDNGNGIPDSAKEKIFQPFFTTKPTGQGTGLGLSLSYDIVTKGHGGNIKVNSKTGKGTIFIIELPL